MGSEPMSWDQAYWLHEAGFGIKFQQKTIPVATVNQVYQVSAETKFIITTKTAQEETLLLLKFPKDFITVSGHYTYGTFSQ